MGKVEQTPSQTREKIYDEPPDLLHFVSLEHEQFLRTLRIDHEEMHFTDHIQGLYTAATSRIKVERDSDVIVFQLLSFTHYHFLFSVAAFMRCHLAESFGSLRCAIDGALVAAHIIQDRPSQIAYMDRKKPFDKLIRHYKNFADRPHKLPHRLIPELIKRHGLCSRFASHADVDVFAHRSRFLDDEQGREKYITLEYFQFPRDKAERRQLFLMLLHTFVIVLDIFSPFLDNEQHIVPEGWTAEMRGLGAKIERTRDELSLAEG